MILARSDEEIEVFRKMDEQRAKDPVYGINAGANKMPRLMSEKELPEIYLSDGNPISDEPEEVKGRGARERTRVKYDDGLTEEQWLNAVDDDEDSPEAAAARKAARKDRREKNRLKRAGELPGSIEASPAGSRDSTEEPEPLPKKGRGRGKKRERKGEEYEDEPPAKRPKPKGRPPKNAAAANANSLPPQQRSILQKSLRAVFDSLMNLESASDDDADDSDEEAGKRLLIGPFVTLPNKKDYYDYYTLIKNPIAMKLIETKIKKEVYTSLGELRADIHTMCNNARTYNEDGSMLFLDANAIEAACNSKVRDEISDHPELAELEGDSRHGTSTAPTTSAGTPAAASGPRVKLTFKANQEYGNGGSSGMQSDEEE